ncbi:hypothetical protein DPMN_128805 [Dreissena polymorpha]|uniref:Uncharacterized protein n=1 Tax=Dreissena polymorpha TaxID=45954 RepID=A0A9D4K0H8_DREPO|nr:hypothetical protein DPMN_128805 [Dreissena polymorpha]
MANTIGSWNGYDLTMLVVVVCFRHIPLHMLDKLVDKVGYTCFMKDSNCSNALTLRLGLKLSIKILYLASSDTYPTHE